MSTFRCLLAGSALALLPFATATANDTVLLTMVQIQVGEEDKADCGRLSVEVEYLGDTILDKKGVGEGEKWADGSTPKALIAPVENGPVINLEKPVKLRVLLAAR